MGVMACNRKGCENIMCSLYSSTYGYICSECFDELITTNGNGKLTLEEFMNLDKHRKQMPEPSYVDFYKNEFIEVGW